MFPIYRIVRARRRQQNLQLIRNRILNRQRYNAFNLSDHRFIEQFNLNKGIARHLINRLRSHVHSSLLRPRVCTLRFYATGSYERCIEEHYNINISQTCTRMRIKNNKRTLSNGNVRTSYACNGLHITCSKVHGNKQ